MPCVLHSPTASFAGLFSFMLPHRRTKHKNSRSARPCGCSCIYAPRFAVRLCGQRLVYCPFADKGLSDSAQPSTTRTPTGAGFSLNVTNSIEAKTPGSLSAVRGSIHFTVRLTARPFPAPAVHRRGCPRYSRCRRRGGSGRRRRRPPRAGGRRAGGALCWRGAARRCADPPHA